MADARLIRKRVKEITSEKEMSDYFRARSKSDYCDKSLIFYSLREAFIFGFTRGYEEARKKTSRFDF